MDSNKIGKLIKELRKKNNLTQEQLADKVGVGFRAVSKWERGINIPELSNIYELCKIFNITKDELLAGELQTKEKLEEKDNTKKKIPSSITITISIITIIILIFTSVFIYQNNRTYSYRLVCNEKEKYYVDGTIYLNKNNISIAINKIDIKDTTFKKNMIENYEYTISINKNVIFGYGFLETTDHIDEPISVENFLKAFNSNFEVEVDLKPEKVLESNIKLIFKFLDNANNQVTKEIDMSLELIK